MAQFEPLKGAKAGQPNIGPPPVPLEPVVPELPPAPVEVEDELVDMPVEPVDPVAIMPVVIPSEPAAFPVPSPLRAPPQATALASVANAIKNRGRSGRFMRSERCDMTVSSFWILSGIDDVDHRRHDDVARTTLGIGHPDIGDGGGRIVDDAGELDDAPPVPTPVVPVVPVVPVLLPAPVDVVPDAGIAVVIPPEPPAFPVPSPRRRKREPWCPRAWRR
jgi:hypothetical protein